MKIVLDKSAKTIRRRNNSSVGYVGFICENLEHLKRNITKLRKIRFNIYKLETGQFYVETYTEMSIDKIEKKISSSCFMIDRETLTAKKYMDEHNVNKKDRVIYLVDTTNENKANPIFKPMLLKNRIAEDFCLNTLPIDITTPMTKSQIIDKKLDNFIKIYFAPTKTKLSADEIENLKKAGEEKRKERASKKI